LLLLLLLLLFLALLLLPLRCCCRAGMSKIERMEEQVHGRGRCACKHHT
jgi:hypothetical protein